MKRKVLFHINGGIGRCICFTGVLEKFAKDNQDVEVNILTSYPDVFYHNPYINKIYPLNTPYLFEEVISKMEYIEPEPYTMKEYYAEHKHIINCFNILVNKKDEFVKPKIYLTEQEKYSAEQFVKQHKKKVVLFQPWGRNGGLNKSPDISFRSLRYPFAEKLVKELKKEYELFLVKEMNQDGFPGVNSFNNTLRQMIALIPYVHGIVGIDSFLQHASFAFDKPSFVFWTSTLEGNLGYPLHKNVRNQKEFIWTPVRIFMNDPNVESKNKEINMFEDSYIKKVIQFLKNKR